MPDRNEADRPVQLVCDAIAGTATYVPLTDEEWDEHEQRLLLVRQAEDERQRQQVADDALLRDKAQQDPAFAALGRRMGVQL